MPKTDLTPRETVTLRPEMTSALIKRTGLNDAVLTRLVHGFYDRIRRDALLGPIFAERISDWEPHLARMVDFWSSVALMTGRYHGSPMQAHLGLPVEQAHFDRWLDLFSKTACETCSPEGAAHVIDRAKRIAVSIHGNVVDKRDGYGRSATPPKLGST
ncbi:group III truncated hemoglobin [Paracoccus sediminicola]|uniref:group III truncated hemoglobin n=1 Tax=Paracoccus sediminicola TaxID=3017783 RepID=UPI0022F0C9ED|nr:group III truncated hemoglobin [Paracoccus sediminicola]WBU58742.1 group III truncated hemoglobin [Paracoccus sediminicola]